MNGHRTFIDARRLEGCDDLRRCLRPLGLLLLLVLLRNGLELRVDVGVADRRLRAFATNGVSRLHSASPIS